MISSNADTMASNAEVNAQNAAAPGKKRSKPKKAAPKSQKAVRGGKAKAGRAIQTASAKTTESARKESKTATVLELLQRAKGATLAEIMEATSWQAHSVRGFISGTLGKKMRLTVNSEKREGGVRVYSIAT